MKWINWINGLSVSVHIPFIHSANYFFFYSFLQTNVAIILYSAAFKKIKQFRPPTSSNRLLPLLRCDSYHSMLHTYAGVASLFLCCCFHEFGIYYKTLPLLNFKTWQNILYTVLRSEGNSKMGGNIFFITALKINFLVGYKKHSCMLQQKNPGFELQPDISVRPRF